MEKLHYYLWSQLKLHRNKRSQKLLVSSSLIFLSQLSEKRMGAPKAHLCKASHQKIFPSLNKELKVKRQNVSETISGRVWLKVSLLTNLWLARSIVMRTPEKAPLIWQKLFWTIIWDQLESLVSLGAIYMVLYRWLSRMALSRIILCRSKNLLQTMTMMIMEKMCRTPK
jgi:hypothetical protein